MVPYGITHDSNCPLTYACSTNDPSSAFLCDTTYADATITFNTGTGVYTFSSTNLALAQLGEVTHTITIIVTPFSPAAAESFDFDIKFIDPCVLVTFSFDPPDPIHDFEYEIYDESPEMILAFDPS